MLIIKKKGVTLIELIVVLALTPIVLSLIFNVISSLYRMSDNETKRSNATEQAKTYISMISNDLKNCRTYLDSEEIEAVDDLNKLIPSGGKAVVYIESFNNERYMYVMAPSGEGKYDLQKIVFKNGVTQNSYKAKKIKKEDGDEDYDKEYVDEAVFEKCKMDKKNVVLDLTINPVSPYLKDADLINYQNEFLYYDNFAYETFLFVSTVHDINKIYYKVELERHYTYDAEVESTTTLMKYVKEAKVIRNQKENKLTSVYVKTEDEGNIKEISSDVYVFTQS
ncbi:MAG: type II secretion system protein [Clostridiales bacterium]|uniref:type II secretion system protein n=1 Tax=Clostridium sp. N3C TaxID=1776758 RepID=UPI00092DFC48|nr:type II secretion system protein [Clostridium sp. N3C]NLZ47933.1 type II secretion system protein [Clostridiales bacterium]SCN22482.1 hypothetical protein N3C_0811 [Clostridium sp. N3C]